MYASMCWHRDFVLGKSVKEIHARARDPTQAKILRAIGATETIEIETDFGRRHGRPRAGK